jgi:hypothetical protein
LSCKSIFIIKLDEAVNPGQHLACSVQFRRAIHDFGFPGWPELNLDWVTGYWGVRSI